MAPPTQTRSSTHLKEKGGDSIPAVAASTRLKEKGGDNNPVAAPLTCLKEKGEIIVPRWQCVC